MTTEYVQTGNPTTVFEVWKEILEKHPEVVRQTAKIYANHPHGETTYQHVEVLPRERIIWSDTQISFWGPPNKVKAIGARVELRPKDFDPAIDYSGADRWFNEGDVFLKIEPDREKSFIVVDFESKPSEDMLNLVIKTLNGWKPDWYLLDTGGSYHLIVDKLVDPKVMPKYFGRLIMDMAKNLNSRKSILYGHIGKYLIENSDNKNKLRLWTRDVLDMFGHDGEPLSTGKLVFPIDMRWIAHVVEAIVHDDNNEGYLRVSSKYGSVPVLAAQQINEKITIFQSTNSPFIRQRELPGL